MNYLSALKDYYGIYIADMNTYEGSISYYCTHTIISVDYISVANKLSENIS